MHDNTYYLLYTTGSNVQVTASSNLAEWAETGTVVYTPPSPYTDVWAPELHYIDGTFYIYVAMAQNGDNSQHRMYVLEGTSATDPTQPFEVGSLVPWQSRCVADCDLQMVGQITSPDDNWAIDGTVLIVSVDSPSVPLSSADIYVGAVRERLKPIARPLIC